MLNSDVRVQYPPINTKRALGAFFFAHLKMKKTLLAFLISSAFTTTVAHGQTASGVQSTATGSFSLASGNNSTATGYAAQATGNDSTATGQGASAIADQATATGQGSMATGIASTANGAISTATGNYSTAVGTGAAATGNFSTAVGMSTNAQGLNSTAIGDYAATTATGSTALGFNASASHNNSVAIGTNSTTNAANVVSVGDAGTSLTRKIVNLADGTANTDAVTVGQMNAAIAAAGGAGPQGPQGIQGVQGIQGEKGEKGDRGADGVVDYSQVNGYIDTKARATLQQAADDATTKVSTVSLRLSMVLSSVENAQATADSALAGVADAIRYTDPTATRTLQQANAYTDSRVDQLSGRVGALETRIEEVERSAHRGIAASIAMQQAPAAIGPGEAAITAGVGGYGKETAVAVGIHYLTSRNIALSGGIAASPSGGNVAYRLGGSFKF